MLLRVSQQTLKGIRTKDRGLNKTLENNKSQNDSRCDI